MITADRRLFDSLVGAAYEGLSAWLGDVNEVLTGSLWAAEADLLAQNSILKPIENEIRRRRAAADHVVESRAGVDCYCFSRMIEDEVVMLIALCSAGDFDSFGNARE